MADAKATVQELLALADVKINGPRQFDIQVHDERFYARAIAERELGLGESYMDGWWDVERLDELVCRLLNARLQERVRISPAMAWVFAKNRLLNRQTTERAKRNASSHYNIGNDLYERMLDKRMIYSCAYWKDAANLDEAQEAKLDLICRKLHLQPGMTLLDIGCGWGGFVEYAAEKYGVSATGITPATEQVAVAADRTKHLPVTILQKDYREIKGRYDRIVSIGMLEHVGPKNYPDFFNRCKNLLQDGGIMLHHFIGGAQSKNYTDPWIDRHIFPGGVIPSLAQVAKAVERQLIIEDVQNFGPYYDKTLMAWCANFQKHYAEISARYDERFYRMWTYYLLTCAGAFRARHMQLFQVVMRKLEPSGVYEAVR